MRSPVMVRLRRSIEKDVIRLRLRSFRDLPVLYDLFSEEVINAAGSRNGKPFSSLLSFWKWLRTTFQVVYLVEWGASRKKGIIGFIGLYDLVAGEEMKISMAIFDPSLRNRGLGRRCLRIFLEHMVSSGVCRSVTVRILRSNIGSLDFFAQSGFKVTEFLGNKIALQWRPAQYSAMDSGL